jgi:hypothetical protein
MCLSIFHLAFHSRLSNAQSTEDQFKDLFITAGYATAFGAALGAATLSFKSNPESHLRFIAVGASLGFFGGSVLGTYVAFSPAFTWNEPQEKGALPNLVAQHSASNFTIVPNIDLYSTKISSWQGQWTLSRF